MAIISVKNIKPGMVLSEDVVHATGRVLLKKGSELTENHFKIFKTWGVSSLQIKNKDNESIKIKKNHSPNDIKRLINNTKVRFQHCDLNQPFMNELFRICVKMSLEQKDEKI